MYEMEQDVENNYRTVCSACLSSDRTLFGIIGMPATYQMFRLIMYDFPAERKRAVPAIYKLRSRDSLKELFREVNILNLVNHKTVRTMECISGHARFRSLLAVASRAGSLFSLKYVRGERWLTLHRTGDLVPHVGTGPLIYLSVCTLHQQTCHLSLQMRLFGATIPEMEPYLCWECVALLRRLGRFKNQVHRAQEHLRVLALSSSHETLDHTYMSQSLSSLETTSKEDYDKIFFDYTVSEDWQPQYISVTGTEDVKNEQYDVAGQSNITLDIDEHLLEVPEIVLENPVTGVMSHIVVDTDAYVTHAPDVKGELSELTLSSLAPPPPAPVMVKPGYITEYMSQSDMMKTREELKNKVQYASAVYKCELCIIGFYIQQQVEDHFVECHRQKPGHIACKVCYVYIEENEMATHTDTHYFRYICKLCGHVEYSSKIMGIHVKTHSQKHVNKAVIKIGDAGKAVKGRKKKTKDTDKSSPKPGDLRKLLSKTTIEGYQCLECDMFFKNSRSRKNHVARCHREGLQCDHCKKRFVNRTTLATHLKLHEGPLPREECPICGKMVRSVQLKYHVQRHQNTDRYCCQDCQMVFSHHATYQAHLKYSRAHAPDHIFKYPCPMCHKGYPTKEQMQDHFNYQHLGKTAHKCPVCDKPIASRANVQKHMLRVHGDKKQRPRNHTCQVCGKAFTDKKALTQHTAIHSGERPLSCDICQQTFKQKASLYTHRKRVHKVVPARRRVEYIDSNKPQ